MRNRYLVTYDIANEKRLRLVFKKMKGFGDHLQYSVFTCDLSDKERVLMVGELKDIINHREDRICIADIGPVSGRGSESMMFIGKPLEVVGNTEAVVV